MRWIPTTFLLLFSATFVVAEEGSVLFEPGDQTSIPKYYRLDRHRFSYHLSLLREYPISGFNLYALTFPSPVESPHHENNTVYGYYYRPLKAARFPCVVVLHITGGDQSESKLIASYLAQRGIGALRLQMAYYGPRRPKGSSVRMLSTDVFRTAAAIRQTVLDIRRAAAWMASRREIDRHNLGVVGTSLGGFMAALSAEMEPKFRKVVILLAGGGLVDGFYDHPQAKHFIERWESLGGTKELLRKLVAPFDPLTFAENLKRRDVLMIAARHDEIVSPKMAKALWEASGRQRIVWLNSGHYTAALHLVTGLRLIEEHIRGPVRSKPQAAKS